jgi:hypothetical protein
MSISILKLDYLNLFLFGVEIAELTHLPQIHNSEQPQIYRTAQSAQKRTYRTKTEMNWQILKANKRSHFQSPIHIRHLILMKNIGALPLTYFSLFKISLSTTID